MIDNDLGSQIKIWHLSMTVNLRVIETDRTAGSLRSTVLSASKLVQINPWVKVHTPLETFPVLG